MKVLFTCGGTGGHINPALAVAKMLRAKRPECEILFVGATGGMETQLIPQEGFEIKTIDIEGVSRKFTFAGMKHNISVFRKVLTSGMKARKILRDFNPDVVMGTGGYACFPILKAASKLKIPTIIHEANAYPGLVTRTLGAKLTRVLVNFDATKDYLKYNHNIKTIGMPVRQDILFKDKSEARAELGIDERPLVVSFFGSLGAREMNKAMAEFIKLECETGLFNHIHAMGKFGSEWMPNLIAEKGIVLHEHPDIDLREYIHDMPRVMAAADVIICRGGASTVSEIAAAGKPAIIIPSPNVAENHQEKNAKVLSDIGGAFMLRESEVTGKSIYDKVCEIAFDGEKLKDMSKNLSKVAILDGCERIYKEIAELAKKS
ncbi:MAG: undecaprenyldiphospho-muramoylpentapeptide beta-N-acetylglucosaminyltransferase [Clostridia bacterium]|nr:undecaprenyldiphospho-muramoylpentapeptide beta-N-acetylglucosaminyltransferase [Clostridia bacterium]